MFFDALQASDFWLIVGYSFRDQSVNSRLAAEFRSRVELPKVLVIEKGSSVPDQTIEAAFGWNEDDMGSSGHWLTIDRSGLENLAHSPNWKNFVSNGNNSS
jgi:hypothetical protein